MSELTTQTTLGAPPAAAVRGGLARLAEAAGAPVSVAARAPVMFDVMGGIAELGGALALSTPSAESVRVAVAPRTDQRLHIVRLDSSGGRAQRNGQDEDDAWQLAAFYAGESLADAASVRALLASETCTVRSAVLCAAYALLAGRVVPHLAGGFTVVIEADRRSEPDAQFLSAVQGAAAVALTRALGVPAEAGRLAGACRAVRGDLLGCPTGIMTQIGALLGKPKHLLQVCCGSSAVREYLPLPAGVTLLGLDCGSRSAQSVQKYCAALTAALMGREIIARLIPAVCQHAQWDGSLARVSVTDFVDHLRDRIPTKLKGIQYLDRFGPLEASWAHVEPAALYKVRSRAEHHIYEDDRVRQFAERLARARRTGDDQPVREAGELMYASHWSYGQRCGLGSIESDLLVNLLRSEGAQRGIFGARVSGAGCGGLVVVMLRDDAAAQQAIDRVLAQFKQRIGRPAELRPIADDDHASLSVEAPA